MRASWFFCTSLILISSSLAVAVDSPLELPRIDFIQKFVKRDRANWYVDLRFKYVGKETLTLGLDDVAASVESYVSNSAVDGHGLPRKSSLRFGARENWTSKCQLVNVKPVATIEDLPVGCAEVGYLAIWNASPHEESLGPPDSEFPSRFWKGHVGKRPERSLTLTFGPESEFEVRLLLIHNHAFFGDERSNFSGSHLLGEGAERGYDPLLGVRRFELDIAGTKIVEEIVLRDAAPAMVPPITFDGMPTQRDDRMFISAPDALFLSAPEVGSGALSTPQYPVRHGSRVRITFWYYLARGTQRSLVFRALQYCDLAGRYHILNRVSVGATFCTNERWQKVEKIVQIDPMATKLGLIFQLPGDPREIGDAWIDDVRIETLTDDAGLYSEMF